VKAALADTASLNLQGVHSHYKQAAHALGKSDFAGSMRESIHALASISTKEVEIQAREHN
jgi:hypothetical protein